MPCRDGRKLFLSYIFCGVGISYLCVRDVVHSDHYQPSKASIDSVYFIRDFDGDGKRI